MKDVYSLAAIYCDSLQSENSKKELQNILTQEKKRQALPQYLKEVPEKLKEILMEILVEHKHIPPSTLAKEFFYACSYISHGVDKSDQYPMPQKIEIKGLEVALFSNPLEELGGDFYDLIQLSNNKHGILMGDIMGHGLKASFHSQLICAIPQMLANFKIASSEVLAQMDTLLYKSGRQRHKALFATALYGVLCLNENLPFFQLSNAGHPAPILYRKGHEFADPQAHYIEMENLFLGEVKLNGSQLGIGPSQFTVMENFIPIQKNDVLVFYSDGIIEIGEERDYSKRLLQIITKLAHRSVQEIKDGIIEDIKEFCGSSKWQQDDATLIIIKIL